MFKKLNCKIKSFTNIVQIADIHVTLMKRHDEFKLVFEKLYTGIKNTPLETCIVVCGDILHNKTEISPESLQLASDFLYNLAEIRPTIVIPGNHDLLVMNKSRLDSITPIIDTLDHSNLFYLKESGLYGFGNILFNNYSVVDDPDVYILHKDIPPVYINEYKHHIALYHGSVNGSLTDMGYMLINKAMPVEKFDGHHVVLLGDVHKCQNIYIKEDEVVIPENELDKYNMDLWEIIEKIE